MSTPDKYDEEENIVNRNALLGRSLEWAVNSEKALEEHKQVNGNIVRTRFPPEPNGYLHIGHAKSMNMNFHLSFEKLGVPLENRRTIFRYDDTNPEAESNEYIDSIRRDLEWLGWKPERTTFSSDNFEKLYEFAIILIKKELAYVCDMTKNEMEGQRDLAKRRVHARNSNQNPDDVAPIPSEDILPGRNRNTSVERNLKLFENMRRGMYEEGQYTLRLKMDMNSDNPNMYDLVAYRIKFVAHPHVGNEWCIYPSYDFTHGICDSLEHIDYSICTLEFETRREPYYWILWALDLYKPKVYEMSRLNVAYNVLSKRRLLKLVSNKIVRGWDAPNLLTISGLRRRGYNKHILNSFCSDIGATRAMNTVEIEKLQQTARQHLALSSPRAMVTLDPIQVIITNFLEQNPQQEYDVSNFPNDESLGTHKLLFTSTIHIDSSDFRLKDNPLYYGLAPQKAVGLKYYGGNLICDEVIQEKGKIIKLLCRIDKSDERKKPNSYITWVPANSIPCEVRIYNHLFIVPEPTDRYEEELNPKSEAVYKEALIDDSVLQSLCTQTISKWESNPAFQFERFGYFVVDTDTSFNPKTRNGTLIFNGTVSLKEDNFKKEVTDEEIAAIEARREEARHAREAKEARMKIDPKKLFQLAPDYQGKYSQYNSNGIPTHLADGTELTKSAMKKLTKEQTKHIKALAHYTKKK